MVYAPGLCKMWIFDKKITGKSKKNKRIWKRPREGPRKAAAEGKNNKKNGPRAALWGKVCCDSALVPLKMLRAAKSV